MGSLLSQFSEDVVQLIEKISPFVVRIHNGAGTGSGFLISPEGYVLTNSHVVQKSSQVLVEPLSKEPFAAQVVGRDDKTDLALLKTNPYTRDALKLVTKDPRIGEFVVAIGSPLRFESTVTMGMVSALHRQLPMPQGWLEGLVQTDAAINPGNSGGPLINSHGEVIGVNTAIVPYAQGLGFAVSSTTASWVTSELIRFGKVRRKFLGVRAHPTNYFDSEQTKKFGVKVQDIEPNSPARRAGLQKNDVIVSVNNETIRFIDDLQKALSFRERDIHEIIVRREDRQMTFYASNVEERQVS